MPDAEVPPTVVDAVLARVHRLPSEVPRALEQLSVVPSRAELPLAGTLLGDLRVLGEAEHTRPLDVALDAVALRHELARRAVEDSLPVVSRRELNGRVLAALRADEHADLAR